jgi:YD repeat-containing protein
MQPAPSAGTARPLKLYTYVQKYAWIKNSGGTLVSANQPIWLPSTETLCQTVAGSNSPVCDSAAPQTVTTYQYGADGTADNLLLHGKAVSSGGTTLRTCYGYDAYSRKISETAPNANLATCP